MDIRVAVPRDHALVAALWYESARRMDGGPANGDDLDCLLARIANGFRDGWHLEVASNGAGLLGFVGFVAMRRADAALDQLFVAPKAQGAGIGSALLDRAKQRMADGFSLRTPVTNLAAQRFYRKHGLGMLYDAPHPYTGAPVRYFRWAP
jgi:ribosomal protein S18 acetylase RimI-like enzyme